MGPVSNSRGDAGGRDPAPPNALGAAIAAWNNKTRESASPILAHIHAGIRSLHQVHAELRHYGEMHIERFARGDGQPAPPDPVPALRSLCTRVDAFEEALKRASAHAEAACAQGEALVRDYRTLLEPAAGRPEPAAPVAPGIQTGQGVSTEDYAAIHALEALVTAQKSEIAALKTLLEETRARQTVDSNTAGATPARPAACVEIQSIQEFVQNSPIASVPVNTSYYARIVEAAAAPEGHRVPMGAILCHAGLITQRQLENALDHQQKGRRKPLGSLLVDLGYTTEVAIAQTVAAQLDLPYVVLSRERIRNGAAGLVPLRMARRHAAMPIDYSDHSLVVAMANPLDLVALEDLHKASQKHIRPCVAAREDILLHIRVHYA